MKSIILSVLAIASTTAMRIDGSRQEHQKENQQINQNECSQKSDCDELEICQRDFSGFYRCSHPW